MIDCISLWDFQDILKNVHFFSDGQKFSSPKYLNCSIIYVLNLYEFVQWNTKGEFSKNTVATLF